LADIPDANVTEARHHILGNVKAWTAKIKGDGTGTTLNVPFKIVVGAFTGNIDDTSAIPGISFADGVITYASAPTSSKYHWLMILGF